MQYIYETHLHTCEASACGITNGADYAEYMKNLGYSGIIVTDHFFNGNSCVSKNLPWEERIDLYCSGYEAALESNKDEDFTVMFGVEFFFDGDEYLLYGVDKKWLKQHPEIMEMTRTELRKCVNDYGGIMIQAHPFRERYYLTEIHLTPAACDGIEVYNASNEPYQNALCHEYVNREGFKMITGGTDIHYFNDKYKGGTAFGHKINSIEEFVQSMKNLEGVPVTLRDGKFSDVSEFTDEIKTDRKPELPVVWHND